MNRPYWKRASASLGLGMLMLGEPALAADLPLKAPVPYLPETLYHWSGWYVGAEAAIVRGSSNWSANPSGGPGVAGSFDLPFNFDFMAGTGSYGIGLQAGYNHVFPSRLMLGVEGDVVAPNSDVVVPYSVRGNQTVTSATIGQVTYGEAVIHYGSARARVGYAFDHFLLYGTGGLAWSYDQLTRTQIAAPAVGGVAIPGTVENRFLWRLG